MQASHEITGLLRSVQQPAHPPTGSLCSPSVVGLLCIVHDAWAFRKLAPHLVHHLLQRRRRAAEEQRWFDGLLTLLALH